MKATNSESEISSFFYDLFNSQNLFEAFFFLIELRDFKVQVL